MNDAILDIDQLDCPTLDQFKPYAESPRPALIRGATGQWQALTDWTPEYLAAKSGDAEVPVLNIPEGDPTGRFFYGGESAGMSRFEDCLGLLSGEPARSYMAGVSIADFLPSLAPDVGHIDFIDREKQNQSQLWISGQDSRGPLHYDIDNNIHVLISGRKRFLMYEYSQSRYLYPYSTLSTTPHYSHVNPAQPDTGRYPLFRKAKGYDVTLKPGEMIYMPTGCWHQVITEEPSVAINFWLGKNLCRRSTARLYFSISLMTAAAVISSPWRAIRGSAASAN